MRRFRFPGVCWASMFAVLMVAACSLDRAGLGAGVSTTPDAGVDAAGGVGGSGGSSAWGGTGATSGEGGLSGSAGHGGGAGAEAGGASGAAGAGGGASGGAAGAGGGAAGAGGVTVDCPDAGGAMVALPGGFCIDATEVTRASYSAWLVSGLQGTQPPECGWNKSFEPLATCMSHPKDVCQGQCDGHPQVCVDWCDAWSYCKSHGKRLCGRLQSGATPTDGFADAAVDAWYRACSSGGEYAWTVGNDVGSAPYACNFGHDSDTLPTVASGSMVGCQSPASGYSGVFDMTGNAAEWQDSCAAGAAEQDLCRLRGGSFDRGADSNRCDADRMEARSEASFATGFRCCFP